MAFSLAGLPAKGADLGLVGREMARQLQDGHYARMPFNAELSSRFLERYLTGLDPERLYFLEGEVADFGQRYGRRWHDLISTKQALPAASVIFERYRKRVEDRVRFSQSLIKAYDFTFTQDRRVRGDRTGVPWPTDFRALQVAWQDRLALMILEERLKRQRLQDRARERGEVDPFQDAEPVEDSVSARLERLWQAVAGMTPEDIANSFFSAVAQAYDPHSEYLSANEMAQFRIDVSNELVGIGARLAMNEVGEIEVKGVVTGGPADQEGGLLPGDRIVAVSPSDDGNWVDIRYQPLTKVIEYILGEEEDPVGLRLKRSTGEVEQSMEISIPRGVVTMKDQLARARVYDYGDEKIAVLTIPSFYFDFQESGNRVSVDVERLLGRLGREKIGGLVLDLRDNPGGSLMEARRLTGFFIGKGPVVQVRSSNGQVTSLDSQRSKPLYDGPLVVVTNRASASATEILAGAIQDYHRGVVVGAPSTFGKGTVQKTVDLSDYMPIFADRDRAGWLKMTFQKYYRVSGSSVQLKGVVPDVVLPIPETGEPEGEGGRKYALPHDVIRASAGFRARERDVLYLPHLQAKSAARIEGDPFFQQFRRENEDLARQREDPFVSLHLENRLAELKETEAERTRRRQEWEALFEKMREKDQVRFRMFRLTLDDLDAETLPETAGADPSENFLRRAENQITALDEEMAWPAGIDAVKREAMNVLFDLIEAERDGLVEKTSSK